MNYSLVYCKFADEKNFKAFDLTRGIPVGNRIYATMIMNTSDNQNKLQKLANLNKDMGLIIQLREGKRVVFQTV